MVRQHLENAEEGASISSPADKMQAYDITDQDVATILGLPDYAFGDIPTDAVRADTRKPGVFTPFKLSAACAMIFAALIGLRWGVPLVWHHTREGPPELQSPMMAAVALSGSTAPSSSPLSADTVIADRSKNLDLRLKKFPRPTLARAGATHSSPEGINEPRSTRAYAGASNRASFDVARTNSPHQDFDPHRSTLDHSSEMRGFMNAKADPDRLARAERLEALDAIRLLRQK